MSCAHTELELCRFARYPAVYRFRVVDATAFCRGKYVERPENPATHTKFTISKMRVICIRKKDGLVLILRGWDLPCQRDESRLKRHVYAGADASPEPERNRKVAFDFAIPVSCWLVWG